jgi:hypothetical protein
VVAAKRRTTGRRNPSRKSRTPGGVQERSPEIFLVSVLWC